MLFQPAPTAEEIKASRTWIASDHYDPRSDCDRKFYCVLLPTDRAFRIAEDWAEDFASDRADVTRYMLGDSTWDLYEGDVTMLYCARRSDADRLCA